MRRRTLLMRKSTTCRRYRVSSWPQLMPHHAAQLLGWSAENYRQFPWREGASPFAKLVGEMLLRKTSAQHAQKAYADLIARYPTPDALLRAAPEDLAGLLRPLGMMNQRVAALKAMAKFLVEHHGGQVPASPAELMKIPHVGRYTANAVCAFAFGLQLPIVDTNVIRVLHRFSGKRVQGARPYTKDEIWRRMARSLPFGQVDRFNYALLDLGATVCRVQPECTACPLAGGCALRRRTQNAKPAAGLALGKAEE